MIDKSNGKLINVVFFIVFNSCVQKEYIRIILKINLYLIKKYVNIFKCIRFDFFYLLLKFIYNIGILQVKNIIKDNFNFK